MEANDPPLGPDGEETLVDRVMARIDVPDTVKEIVEDALRGVADELERNVRSSVEIEIENGLCSFSFHRSVATFEPNGGCEICGEHYSRHDGVLVCKRNVDELRGDELEDAVDDADEAAQSLEPSKLDRPPSFELEPRNLLEVAPGLKVPCQVETAEQRGERLRKEGRDLKRFECEWPQCTSNWLHAHDDECGALEGKICQHMVTAGWQPAVVQVNSLQEDGKTMKRRARLLGWLCTTHADDLPEETEPEPDAASSG